MSAGPCADFLRWSQVSADTLPGFVKMLCRCRRCCYVTRIAALKKTPQGALAGLAETAMLDLKASSLVLGALQLSMGCFPLCKVLWVTTQARRLESAPVMPLAAHVPLRTLPQATQVSSFPNGSMQL